MGAAFNGRTAVVNLLLHHGADIDATDVDGETPMCNAARYGHIDTLECLVTKECDLFATNTTYGQTALHVTAAFSQQNTDEMIRFLVCEVRRQGQEQFLELTSNHGNTTLN